jgi:archaetidylinositol phosphate synthase
MNKEIIYQPFRRVFLTPVLSLLADKLQLSPQLITVFAMLVGVLCPVALLLHDQVLAVSLLIISGYLDVLDGAVARRLNCCTARGAFLDIFADRVVEFSVIYGLYLVDPWHRGDLVILMLGSILLCITSFLVVGIFSQNQGEKSFHYSPGIIERPEAFLFFGAMIVWPQWFSLLAFVFVGLVFLTTIIRVWQFYRFTNQEDIIHEN